MLPDVFTRIRADVIDVGGYDAVINDPETIRAIAARNGVTVTAVRQTLTQMNLEHRQAHRIRKALLGKIEGREVSRLRAIKIYLLENTQTCTIPRPGELRLVIAGRGRKDDPYRVGLIPAGRRDPDLWINVVDLIALARLAHLE